MNKKLKFSPGLVQMILSCKKTSTWRLFDDKDLKTSDVVDFVKRPEMTKFATARLTDVKEKTFAELTKEDKVGHEEFSSDEEMYKTYSKYYHQTINPKTKVKIIKFKLLEKYGKS